MKPDMESLQQRWNELYKTHLPALAKKKDSVQRHWPVHLDHCFARIVLDNAVGGDRPWTEVVAQPAVRNMTAEQLELAIDLGQRIATGEADLDQLNDRSLELRGKKKRKVKHDELDEKMRRKKRKEVDGDVSSYFLASPKVKEAKAKTSKPADSHPTEWNDPSTTQDDQDDPVDISAQLQRIKTSTITPFRKQALTLLCQIPRGRYSTYQTLSDHITRTSHKTCARAVGNAMRNNPFAPEVPCHRVLAHDGSLGGFNGSWGEKGEFANEKHRLLFEEGVRFDSRGRVKGPAFDGFTA